MKLLMDAMALRRGLDAAYRILDRSAANPGVYVLLQTKGPNALEILATDLVLWVARDVEAEIRVDGALVVDCKKFRDLIAHMKGKIEISSAPMQLEIRSGNAAYQLHGRAAEDFPRAPETGSLVFHRVDGATLHELIDRVSFSIGEDPFRPAQNGVLFESDGETARMVSTDGHRLTRIEHPLPGAPTLPAGVIIPRKGVLEIKKVVPHEGGLELAADREHLYVRGEDTTLAVRPIAATFPNYLLAAPEVRTKDQIRVDRRALLDAIQRARIVATLAEGVQLSAASCKLTVSGGSSTDLGAFREDVPVEYGGPDGASARFNPAYLADFLKAATDHQILVQIGPGELDPAVLRASAGAHLGVIMPLKL